MKARPVIPRALANQDVEDAIGYYVGGQAEQAALGFIDALEKTCTHISRHPAFGMPRYAHEGGKVAEDNTKWLRQNEWQWAEAYLRKRAPGDIFVEGF